MKVTSDLQLAKALTPQDVLNEQAKASDLGTTQATIGGIAVGLTLSSITDSLGFYD